MADGEEVEDLDECSSEPLPNDPEDADSGGNNLQNYPEFTSAVINTSGNLILQYKVDSDPANSNYGGNGLYIEFFKADENLQGETYISSTYYTADDYLNGAPGIATFDAGNAASLGINPGDKIIATATDNDGNTSEFTGTNIGIVGNPTLVKLERFTANGYGNQVLLRWQTGFEADNLGFKIYREEDGTRTLITRQLIAGSALTDGPGTSLLSGHVYYWADTPPAGKSIRYWLEDIDLNGKSTMNGPYAITSAPDASPSEVERRSVLLAQIGMREGLLAGGLGSVPLTRTATLAQPSAATLESQTSMAGQAAVKITVREEGYYRITQPELVQAGLDPKSDPRLLQLFADGVEQAIKVTGEQDGRLDAGDAVEFYGMGLDTPSTDRRVYWLVAGAGAGKRIVVTEGKGEAGGCGWIRVHRGAERPNHLLRGAEKRRGGELLRGDNCKRAGRTIATAKTSERLGDRACDAGGLITGSDADGPQGPRAAKRRGGDATRLLRAGVEQEACVGRARAAARRREHGEVDSRRRPGRCESGRHDPHHLYAQLYCRQR